MCHMVLYYNTSPPYRLSSVYMIALKIAIQADCIIIIRLLPTDAHIAARSSATVTDKMHTACYRVRNPKYLT